MQRATPIAPPEDLMAAMQLMRAGDDAGALSLAQRALETATDRAPYLAIASLTALRLGQPATAVPMLRELLRINPADRPSAVNLANALIELERFDEAMEVVAHGDDPAFARARGFLFQREGRLEEAAAAYREALAGDPDDLTSWNNLGNVESERGNIDAAIEAFERAITLSPAHLSIYHNLSEALAAGDRNEARARVLRDALKFAPDDYQTLLQLAMTEARLDQIDAAVDTFRAAIAAAPGFGDAHIELGMLFESLNRVDELAELANSVDLANSPPEAAFLHAWRARRAGRFEEAAELARTIPPTVHPMRLHHLIGGIADRLGDAATAFDAFSRMNAATLTTSPVPEGPTFREDVENHLRQWTDEWAVDWPAFTPADGERDPIFLVGFPRSGTTLLDTMLMGQPALSVVEEGPMMAQTIRTLTDDENLSDLTPDRIGELRGNYFRFAREAGWDDSRWLVDKHPLSMARIPTIHRLFPGARVILAERHPYDVVLSCFMANFTLNQAMRSFTSLDEAARTYDAVFTAWERGISLFPVEWRPVRYERLVANAEAELRPVIKWLGLEWTDRIVQHTETAKTRERVRTASYSQIGEQVYTRSRDRWRGYAEQLAPVLPILRPWAEKMGYAPE
jgi:tetratricopeptide (TPR) repeat protein